MYVGSVIIGESPTVLAAIADEQVAMAVWLRPDPATSEREFPEALDAKFDGATLELSDVSPDWIFDEIALLGDIFQLIADAPVWSARFETIRLPARQAFEPCPLSLRLFTSFGGDALEWIFPVELGEDAFALTSTTRDRVRRLPAGAVALMRGGDAPNLYIRRDVAASVRPPLCCTIGYLQHA